MNSQMEVSDQLHRYVKQQTEEKMSVNILMSCTTYIQKVTDKRKEKISSLV
jgi:hypothetical protein